MSLSIVIGDGFLFYQGHVYWKIKLFDMFLLLAK